MKKLNPVKNPTPQEAAKVVQRTIERKAHKIQDYPKGARIATVKALDELNFSLNKISTLLGMGKETVRHYLDSEVSDRWVQYSTAIKRIMTERNDVLKYKVGNVIEDKLQEGTKLKLYELTGLYKVLSDVERGLPHQANNTLVQTINVHPSLVRRVVVDGEEVK